MLVADLLHYPEARALRLDQPQEVLTYLLNDSRRLAFPTETLFIAIKGSRHDGHAYIEELYVKGFRNFLVDSHVAIDASTWFGANVIAVPDPVACLQWIAANHRAQFKYPVVGLAGSNGKTIIKEWLSQLLERHYTVVRNPRSYNSQVGVPLALWQMRSYHTLGIFEASTSQAGEMAKLEAMMQPEIGIFTNLGPAHDQGFDNRQHKLAEMMGLFARSKTIIYCRDQAIAAEIEKLAKPGQQLISWSQVNHTGNTVGLKINGRDCYFTLPFTDVASVENAMHCAALMLHLGVMMPEIQEGLNQLQNLPMRLSQKQAINQCYLIDDSYSNDLGSLTIALDLLKQRSAGLNLKRTVIVSDLLESGKDSEQLYNELARLFDAKQVDKVIGIGPEISKYRRFFSQQVLLFPDTKSFLAEPIEQLFDSEFILLKGARSYRFERIASRLELQVHGTRLEVNMDALVHNLNYYRSKLAPETLIMVMVKAFAYGSGSYEIANLMQHHRVNYLAVAYCDEGVELRQRGIHLPIMVLNPTIETFDKMVAHQLEPAIYNERLLRQLGQYLREHKSTLRVHLEIDTGMNRLGFGADEVVRMVRALKQWPEIQPVAVYSHFAASESEEHFDFTLRQMDMFRLAAGYVEQSLGKKLIKHMANSGAIVKLPAAHFDMVRLGIGLYGIEVTGTNAEKVQPVSRLITTLSQIKHIKPGDTVGYGRRGMVNKPSTIGTVAIGYADGYSRLFSQGVGIMKVNGKLAPVIGSVCMDMTMIDLTGLDAKEGDEVIIFDQEIRLSDLAAKINTIPYELLTSISQRVKRVFLAD